MKATLEFNLPEDGDEHRYALAGRDALLALEGIDRWAREMAKYGNLGKHERELLDVLRAELIPRGLLSLLE